MNKATHANSGFILMVTLCFISLISILLLALMQHICLYQKALSKQELQHQRFYQLEHLARRLLRSKYAQEGSSCWHMQDLANEALVQLKHSGACSLAQGKAHYRFIVEDLGIYPCIAVEQEGMFKSSHHLRLSLLIEADEEHSASALQIRLIKAADQLLCLGKRRDVDLGISSWRYFAEYS